MADEYEVSVLAWDHYNVEGESPEEAEEIVREQAKSDLPMSWHIEEINVLGKEP